MVVEGAGAVSLSALIYNKMKIKGEKVACIVSGGNVDWESLKEVIDGSLSSSQIYHDDSHKLTNRYAITEKWQEKKGSMRFLPHNK